MKYIIQSIFAICVTIGISTSCNKDDDGIITTNQSLLEQINTDLAGYKIAFGDENNIYIMNPNGENIEQLTTGGAHAAYVSWGPNAQYVYFAGVFAQGEAWEAYRVNIETKAMTKLSDFNLDVRSLGVSPDGQTLAISVMTGNSNLGNNNDNLTQFSTNLYTVPMSVVESKIIEGTQIKMTDLTPIQSAPNSDQFWFEELSWNHDTSNPVLAYTKTWRYDEDEVSYTHAYTIKPDGTQNTLIAENKDQPIWSIDSSKLSFLDLSFYTTSTSTIEQVVVTGVSGEISGGSFSPNNGQYIIFEIGDENRKSGVAKMTSMSNEGIQIPTNVDVYEPRWSPKIIN